MGRSSNSYKSQRPAQTALLDHALVYATNGWSIIPVIGKRAAGLWKPFQTRAADEATLRKLFLRPGISGLAVITGKVSGGLACSDWDVERAYRDWANANPDEAAILPTVRTAYGYHVYGRLDTEQYVVMPDGELRADSKHYVLLPPSLHPTGITYTWVNPLPPIGTALPPFPASLCGEQSSKTQADTAHPSLPTPCVTSCADSQISEAIAVTLPTGPGMRNDRIFAFARRLKSILPDATADDLRPVVQRWHGEALRFVETQDFWPTWTDFISAWQRIRSPYGASFAAAAAAERHEPSIVDRLGYDGSLARLASLCWHLQRQWGGKPFPLSCKKAGEHLGISKMQAGRLFRALEFDGVLRLITKGTKASGKASEWRFIGEGDEA